jgi:hypothetical protein
VGQLTEWVVYASKRQYAFIEAERFLVYQAVYVSPLLYFKDEKTNLG